MAANFDLFGDLIPEARERAGRPAHVWTIENSNKINLLFATGHDLKDAAKAIGVTVPTLRKHYFFEVEQWRVARLRLTAKQLLRLNSEAEGGNVAAIKELFKRMDKAALSDLAARVADRGKEKPKAKLGKKEMQREAAGKVGGKFAPPKPPGFALN